MPRISEEHFEHIVATLDSTLPKVTIGDFTLTRESSNIRIKHKGDYFVELTRSQATPERIQEITSLPDKYSNSEAIGSELAWEHIPETSYLREWRTEIDSHPLYIEVGRHSSNKQYTVYAPVEDIQEQKYNNFSSKDDVANEGMSFFSLESAVMYAAWYMEEQHPHMVDKNIRAEKVAKRKFREIPGIGDTKVEELVDNRHVRTYDELLSNIRVISRNYRDEAKKAINNRIETGEKIEDNSQVQEISAQILTENI